MSVRTSARQPFHRTIPGRHARREARLQQIAAGRRFPVQHLAGDEHAGRRRSMKRSSTASKATPPAVEMARAMRRRSGQAHRHRLDQLGQRAGVMAARRCGDAMAASCSRPIADRRQARRLAQEGGERLLAARRGEPRCQIAPASCRGADRCAGRASPVPAMASRSGADSA